MATCDVLCGTGVKGSLEEGWGGGVRALRQSSRETLRVLSLGSSTSWTAGEAASPGEDREARMLL